MSANIKKTGQIVIYFSPYLIRRLLSAVFLILGSLFCKPSLKTIARHVAYDANAKYYAHRADQVIVGGIQDAPKSVKCRKPKVLYVTHSMHQLHPNGYGVKSEKITRALLDEGVTVSQFVRPSYFASNRQDQIPNDTANYWVNEDLVDRWTKRHPSSQSGGEWGEIFRYKESLVSALSYNKDINVIHSNSNYINGIAASLAGRSCGVKSIYDVRGLWHLTRSSALVGYSLTNHFRWCERMELRACKYADLVIAPTYPCRDYLISKGIEPQKINVVLNAADAAMPQLTGSNSIMKNTFGYVGALTKYEGVQDVILLMGRTPQADRPRFIIVGDGPYKEKLQDLAKRLKVADSCNFVGRVAPTEVLEWYQKLDFCVLPRIDATVVKLIAPLKLNELSQLNLPAIVSRNMQNIIDPELLPQISVVDFSKITTTKDLYQIFKKRKGHKKIRVATWNDRARQIKKLYEALLQEQA